jgi:hypothetical protein
MPRRTIRANLGKARLSRPVPRGAVFLGGTAGAGGAWLTGHGVIAVSTLLVTAVIIVAELWITKRRDDLFRMVATQRNPDPEVLRAVTAYEAVRSGLLSSEDAARLLRAEHGAPQGASADGKPRPAAVTPLVAGRGRQPGSPRRALSRGPSKRSRPVDPVSRSTCRDEDGQAGD